MKVVGTSKFNDIDSLAYLLIYFQKSLPLDGGIQESHRRRCCEAKKTITSKDLCAGLEPQFKDLLDYAHQRETPRLDYGLLRRRLQRLYHRKSYRQNLMYNWTVKSYCREKLFYGRFIGLPRSKAVFNDLAVPVCAKGAEMDLKGWTLPGWSVL